MKGKFWRSVLNILRTKCLFNYEVGRLGKQLMDRYGKNRLMDIVGEGEGGINWESSTETYAFSSVQSLSRILLFATPRTAACQASHWPSPIPRDCLNHLYWVGDSIQPSHPLSSPSPPAINLSQNQDLF